MKGRVSLLTLLLLLFSCSLKEIGEEVKDGENGVWVAPSVGDVGEQLHNIVYVTGFDYPEGYDWVSDAGQGSVKCSLVVFADDRLLLKVPVGDDYKVSSDPDRHRMIGGHLYTDFEKDSQVYIKKDGKPLFSYPGREALSAVFVEADSVYTLGQNKSGRGFSFRRNGQTVLCRDDGYAFEHLSLNGGKICFAFSERVKTADGGVERYYSVKDGVVSQVAVREDLKKVWDIFHCKGSVCVLSSLIGVTEPVLIEGERLTALPIPAGSTLISCRLIGGDDYVCAEGVIRKDGYLRGIVWDRRNSVFLVDKGKTVSAVCSSDDGAVHCVVNPTSSSVKGTIYRGSEKFTMPSGYACMSPDALVTSNGLLYVGLSSIQGNAPAIWRDGEIQEYRLNGFISSITTVEVHEDEDY